MADKKSKGDKFEEMREKKGGKPEAKKAAAKKMAKK